MNDTSLYSIKDLRSVYALRTVQRLRGTETDRQVWLQGLRGTDSGRQTGLVSKVARYRDR